MGPKGQRIDEEILFLMQILDTEVYTIADIELSEYFFQWCKITDILLQKLKQCTAPLELST